ncbi:MAG TPA: tryptophan synthase subunit alpha, partial [Streptosporangiaceae bacterium]
EEAGSWLEAAAELALDPVFLVAPSSSEQRIKLITAACGGFVYAASVMGITGARTSVGDAAEGLVARIRQHTGLPVAVGLGVSNAAQAAQVARFADGVIVGTAFVQRLLAAPDLKAGCAGVSELAAALAAGVRGQAG